MKIAIDISQIAYEGTGVSRFVEGLTRTIIDLDRDNQWTFFFSALRQKLNPHIYHLISDKGQRISQYYLPPTALSFIWNTVHRLKIEKLIGRHDWVITSDWTEPPSRMKKATIIHDLAYIRYPETVHPVIRKTQEERTSWVKKESRLIFADSEATKNDIVDLLHIPESRIIVNYPGVAIAEITAETNADVVKRLGLEKPFILTVGKIEPRKNLARLITAFKALNRKDVDLVVVGQQGWDQETSKRQSSTDSIRFLGYVTETQLSALYRSCLYFVYPSLYEGFGYPVIEAMMAGAAVATSNCSSLAELGRDAALLFHPEHVEEIRRALDKLLVDESMRKSYAKKGIIRSRQFTWERYFRKMMSALKAEESTS